MDETGITNVHKPGTIAATKGVRHVAKDTNGECGATVTIVCATNVYFSTKEDGGNFDERGTT